MAVLAFVGRALARHWTEFRALHVTLEPKAPWIGLAVLLVGVTYLLQIESWRRLLAGWSQRIGYAAAARTWTVANLGRYLPGKVWSIAGMVVLASRVGVRADAAAASAFGIQALALGTGTAVVAAATPGAASWLRLAAAGLLAAATLGALAWGPTARRFGRFVNAAHPLPALPPSAVLLGGAYMGISWLTYGAAFWALGRGLLPSHALTPLVAAGTFVLGYILGMLALFAPGGVGVREAVYLGLLTPALGSGGAVALTVGSRVLLTLTEAAAAGVAVLVTPRPTPPTENAAERTS